MFSISGFRLILKFIDFRKSDRFHWDVVWQQTVVIKVCRSECNMNFEIKNKTQKCHFVLTMYYLEALSAIWLFRNSTAFPVAFTITVCVRRLYDFLMKHLRQWWPQKRTLHHLSAPLCDIFVCSGKTIYMPMPWHNNNNWKINFCHMHQFNANKTWRKVI